MPEFEIIKEIEGPWTVVYDPTIQPVMEFPVAPPEGFARGVQKPLEDWAAWGLQKFSGLLDSTASVPVDRPGKEMSLDLGQVCHVAEVWVNGKNCGAKLWGPHVFAVGEARRPGWNEIRVRIGNLINNTYGEFTESGLLGPVRLFRSR